MCFHARTRARSCRTCDITLAVGDDVTTTEEHAFDAGDLLILPRGVPHIDASDYTAVYFQTKASVFGKAPGTSQHPHIAYVYTKQPRPTPEVRDALNDPGACMLMDSRETYSVYLPNPILRMAPNPTG